MSTVTNLEVYRHKYGEIPKLNGQNYQSWRINLLQGLGAIDGEEIATGERQPPPGPQAQIREYNKLKRQVASIMLSSITEAIQPHVTAHRADPARMLEILDA